MSADPPAHLASPDHTPGKWLPAWGAICLGRSTISRQSPPAIAVGAPSTARTANPEEAQFLRVRIRCTRRPVEPVLQESVSHSALWSGRRANDTLTCPGVGPYDCHDDTPERERAAGPAVCPRLKPG
jgi:hypothetical protein